MAEAILIAIVGAVATIIGAYIRSRRQTYIVAEQVTRRVRPSRLCAADLRRELALLSPHPSLFLTPDVPAKKLTHARASCNIPKDEEVVALIDLSLFGGARSAVVFGLSAMYYNSPFFLSFHFGGKIAYHEFPERHFRRTIGGKVSLGAGFPMFRPMIAAGSARSVVLEALKAVQRLVVA